jgi:hypothetical protein
MLLDTQSAAAIYSLSASFLNKLRVSGGGPPFLKIGRKVLYDDAKFEKWLGAHERRSTSEAPRDEPGALPPATPRRGDGVVRKAKPRRSQLTRPSKAKSACADDLKRNGAPDPPRP